MPIAATPKEGESTEKDDTQPIRHGATEPSCLACDRGSHVLGKQVSPSVEAGRHQSEGESGRDQVGRLGALGRGVGWGARKVPWPIPLLPPWSSNLSVMPPAQMSPFSRKPPWLSPPGTCLPGPFSGFLVWDLVLLTSSR